jgi:hypothetical protein
VFHLFGALAQFEREIIRDRTMAGLAAARARGRNGGRPSKLSADQVRAARRWSTPWSRSAASSGQPHLYIPGLARHAGSGEPGGRHRGSEPATLDVDSWAVGAFVIRPGERLVTVLVTLAVPAGGRHGGCVNLTWPQGDRANAEDAAGLVADAAVSTALEVVSAAGVEGHLPVPGSLVFRHGGGQPWRVKAVSKNTATLTDLSGMLVQSPLSRLAPDPLDATGDVTSPALRGGEWRQNR